MSDARPGPRVAGPDDVGTVVDVLVSAFAEDPTWAWVFPDPATRPAEHAWLWRLFVEGAARYPWVWLTGDDAAAAVWVPPGGTDLSPEQESALERWIGALPTGTAARASAAVERFEAAHPRDEPHFFLSLLGTRATHRAALYELHGFRTHGSFALPDGGPEVVTMWRDPGGR